MPIVVPTQRRRYTLKLNLSVNAAGVGELRIRNPDGSNVAAKIEGVTMSADQPAIFEVAHLAVDQGDYATTVPPVSREPRLAPRSSKCVGSQQNNGAKTSPGLQRWFAVYLATGQPKDVQPNTLPEFLLPGNSLIVFASGPAVNWNMYANVAYEEFDIQ